MKQLDSITVQVDQELAGEVEQMLNNLGLTISQAINLFLREVKIQKNLLSGIRLEEKKEASNKEVKNEKVYNKIHESSIHDRIRYLFMKLEY